MKLNGGQALIKSLEMEGVEVIFGLPGGAILPVYDPIIDSPIRHILVRHEQGAGHMAEGYAHATGKPGVAMVTSGPGATNIVTPLADAYMDSIPMVVITGQVPTAAIGTDAFQEADITGITQSVTKHNFLVTEAQDVPMAIRQAFLIATTGRPGPVLVDIPKDIVDPTNPRSAMEWVWPTDEEVAASLPGYKPTTTGHPKKIKEAVELMLASERPVIYAGGGILNARLGYVKGLTAFGALRDADNLPRDLPHAQFRKLTVDLGFSRRFSVSDRAYLWSSQFSGQHAYDTLYGSQQMLIGGSSSVRGFLNSVLSGDSGSYLRNELSMPWQITLANGSPLSGRVYTGFDVGHVSNRASGVPSGTLSGATLGASVQWKTLSLDAFAARAIDLPHTLKREGTLYGFRLSASL